MNEIASSNDLEQFLAVYNPNDQRRLVTVDVDPASGSGKSPFILVRCGKHSAIINAFAVSGGGGEYYLDLDIHPFVAGQDATGGVFGVTSGHRHETGWQTGVTSAGWPSADRITVLVGEQVTDELAGT